ncbi:MAG: DegV family protein [Clostridia bacterium]|nr:DegV family protein [Clostridia bacterium]
MIKIFVDSGSSIKQNEKEKYGVEIFPLKINLGGKEYSDGIDLSLDTFYHALIQGGLFPQTSLPNLDEAQAKVKECVAGGDQVLIICISSGISGTFSTFKMLFESEPNVRVIDSKTAVGGIKILVNEANKYLSESLDFVEEKLSTLIPRIKVIAIPETLDYLHKGGRLSSAAWIAGSVAHVKPLISLNSITGRVEVAGKALGTKRAISALVAYLEKHGCDQNHKIIPSYTYCEENLYRLITATDQQYLTNMDDFDNLDPAIACHWGPNAYGYIFVSKEEN